MKREDIKIGQKVSFYFKGRKGRYGLCDEEARMVYGYIKKLHRTNAQVEEKITPELKKKYDYMHWYLNFYVHPSELTKEEQ